MKVTHIGRSVDSNSLMLYVGHAEVVPFPLNKDREDIIEAIAQVEAEPYGWCTVQEGDEDYESYTRFDDYTKVTVEEFFQEEK